MTTRRHRGRRDQAARKAWAPKVATGLVNCWACGLPITPTQPWDLGHLEDLATGGAAAGPRRPEHRAKADCPAGGNRRRGAELGRALRRGDDPTRRRGRLSQWLRLFGGSRHSRTHLCLVSLPLAENVSNLIAPGHVGSVVMS